MCSLEAGRGLGTNVCVPGGSSQNPQTHRVGGKPLHRDLSPSLRVIFTKASWGESRAPGSGVTGGKRTNNPPENTLTPLWDREAPAVPGAHQRAREVAGGLVPGGAAVAVLAHVQVVHEPVAVQETLP